MRRKLAAVYVYNSKYDTFAEYHNLSYERVDFTQQFDGVQDHIYACDYAKNIRIEVSKHAGDIYHNRLNHEYIVYLNKPDKIRGAELIANYILNRNEIETSYHEKRVADLHTLHEQFVAFKEKYVTEPKKREEEFEKNIPNEN